MAVLSMNTFYRENDLIRISEGPYAGRLGLFDQYMKKDKNSRNCLVRLWHPENHRLLTHTMQLSVTSFRLEKTFHAPYQVLGNESLDPVLRDRTVTQRLSDLRRMAPIQEQEREANQLQNGQSLTSGSPVIVTNTARLGRIETATNQLLAEVQDIHLQLVELHDAVGTPGPVEVLGRSI